MPVTPEETKSDPFSLRGTPIRGRLVELLAKPAPITILNGMPGSSKSTLITQLDAYLRERVGNPAPGGPASPEPVLVRFPRRHLGEKTAMSLCLQAFAHSRPLGHEQADLVSRMRRGLVELREWELSAPSLCRGFQGVPVLLVNYEWQSTPALDRLLVAFAQAGLDIVCPLLDAETVVSFAEVEGVSVRVIGDAQLVYTREEVAELVRRFGVDPTPELVSAVHTLTAGHPMLSAAMLMRLIGIARVDSSGGEMTATIRGDGGSLRRVKVADLRPVGAGTSLRTVDASTFGVEDFRMAAGLLRFQEFALREFLKTPQGTSRFMTFVTALAEVPWVDLDALESVAPEGARYIQRLSDAGYGSLELGRGVAGRFVWSPGFRVIARDWSGRPAGAASSFVVDLARWYGDHDQVGAAVELLGQTGDINILEGFASTHFSELMAASAWSGLWSNLPLAGFDGSRQPATTILVALELDTVPGGSETFRRTIAAVVAALEERLDQSSPVHRMRTGVQLLTALALQGRWSAHPGLGEAALDALDGAVTSGWGNRQRVNETLEIIGVLCLYRCEFAAARRALSRVTLDVPREAQASPPQPATTVAHTWVTDTPTTPGAETARMGDDTRRHPFVRAAMTAIEGYFGEGEDECARVGRRPHGVLAGPTSGTKWAREGRILDALATTWTLVVGEDYEGALEVMSGLVGDQLVTLARPFVSWSYGLVLLLNGRAEEAFAMYSSLGAMQDGVDGLDGQGPQVGSDPGSPFVTLGAVLSAVATGHTEEAMVLASRTEGSAGDVVDLLVRLLLDVPPVDRDASVSHLLAGLSNAPNLVPRARTLLRCASAAVLVRGGHVEQAREILREVAALSRARDIRFACRFLTSDDCGRLADLVRPDGSPELAEELAAAASAPHAFPVPLAPVSLSPPERAVLDGVCRGLTNAQIAAELFISVNTVKTHLQRIYRRLGVDSREDAAAVVGRWRIPTS